MLACPNIPDIVEAAIIAVFEIFLLFSHVVTTEQPVSEGVAIVSVNVTYFTGVQTTKWLHPLLSAANDLAVTIEDKDWLVPFSCNRKWYIIGKFLTA